MTSSTKVLINSPFDKGFFVVFIILIVKIITQKYFDVRSGASSTPTIVTISPVNRSIFAARRNAVFRGEPRYLAAIS
jgi:hypothetical protein